MERKKFCVLGGDLRSVKLAKLIASDGYEVNIYGFRNAGFEVELPESENLKAAMDEADVIIGPLPFTNDDETINAPFHDGKIYITEALKTMTKNQLLIAGRISEKVLNLADVYKVYTIDILEREDMAILNAIPTAEGAIQIAMEELPITLHSSNALILGFGRIGKILAKMLSVIDSNVYVAARKSSDIAWIKAYNYKPVHLSQLKEHIPKMDLIINTIPHVILDQDMLVRINKECLVIDLASKPGGVDFEKAKELGIKTIWALSLPGKVAPVTAAKFIKDTVYNIIDELGV